MNEEARIRRVLDVQDQELQQWVRANIAYLTAACGPLPWTDAGESQDKERTEEKTMGKRQVFRYTIPVDDQPHTVHLTNDPLHVANGQLIDEVEFWAEHDMEITAGARVHGLEKARLGAVAMPIAAHRHAVAVGESEGGDVHGIGDGVFTAAKLLQRVAEDVAARIGAEAAQRHDARA